MHAAWLSVFCHVGWSATILGFFAIASLSAKGTSLTADARGKTSVTNSLDRRLACGPNSLFMFLILSGHRDLNRQQLDAIPIGTEGASFKDLRDAASKLGVATEIRRFRPHEFDSLQTPAIVQLRSDGSLFHFNVLARSDSRHLHMLDGNTGEKIALVREHFPNFWTGYALTASGHSKLRMVRSQLVLPLAGCLLVINLFMLFDFTQGFRRHRRTASTGVRIE